MEKTKQAHPNWPRPAVPLAPALLVLIILFSVSFAEQVRGVCMIEEPPLYSCDLSSVCTSGYTCKPDSIGGTFNGLARCQAACVTERTPIPPPPPGPAFAWQPAVGAALAINILVIGLLLMAVLVLHLEQIKGMAYDEAGQLLVTIVLVALLIAGLPEAESISRAIACAGGNYACTLGPAPVRDMSLLPLCGSMMSSPSSSPACPSGTTMDWANKVTQNHIKLLEAQILYATEFNAKVGAVSSVSAFCNLMGTGLTVAGCSAYGVLRGPVGQLLNAQGLGLLELKAQQLLLSIASNYALSLILPLGLLLRCLHFTRKAGGTLIALALSIYIVLPISIVLAQSLADGFAFTYPSIANLGSGTYQANRGIYPSLRFDYALLSAGGSLAYAIECDPTEPDEQKFIGKVQGLMVPLDANNRPVQPSPYLAGTLEAGSTLSERVLFLAIVRTLLMAALALTMVITSVRVLGRIFGAEIEVWSIARLS